jgi:GNAT superfamily N-acetyltransferase
MNIYPLAEEDIPSVINLIHRNMDEVMAKHHSPAILAKFRAEITPQAMKSQMLWKHVLVVRLASHIVATGAVANFGTKDAPRYNLSMFFVQPELHGHGIGRVLLDRSILCPWTGAS